MNPTMSPTIFPHGLLTPTIPTIHGFQCIKVQCTNGQCPKERLLNFVIEENDDDMVIEEMKEIETEHGIVKETPC